MIYAIQITLALGAGAALLMLISEQFAYAVSRLVEAALDAVEYRLALRAKRHAENSREEFVMRKASTEAPLNF
jgi:hypothetical protein